MVKLKIGEDRFKTWNINGDGKTWVLDEDATITVFDRPAIDVLATSVGNTLNLLGDIVAFGDNSEGVLVSGANTKIVVGRNATIDASDGISGEADGMLVVNRGDIDGMDNGIASNSAARIRNSGEVSGYTGIAAISSSSIVNGKDGIIRGENTGVFLGFGDDSVLINHGIISGNDHAVRQLSGGDNRLVNTGRIHGDIVFGSGNDLLDSRKGVINGDVTGGDGNDTYRIGKNHLEIFEQAGEGTDRVYSSVSHDLDDNLENLYLTGKKNISGTGNDDDNFIIGNSGTNTLVGGEGDDYVGGGKGDDVLSGGGGDDFLMFNRDDDRDRIVDFTDGEDIIWMTGFQGVTTFDQLQSHMFKNGSDVWIQMGHGDRLILDSTDLSELDASDFSFLVL